MKSDARGRRTRIMVAVLCALGLVLLASAYVATVKFKQQRCAHNLKAIYQAMSLYSISPSTASHDAFVRWVDDGVLAADQIVCPLNGQEYQLSVPVQIRSPDSAILARAPDWEPLVSLPWLSVARGGNILYGDGHVKFQRAAHLPSEP